MKIQLSGGASEWGNGHSPTPQPSELTQARVGRGNSLLPKLLLEWLRWTLGLRDDEESGEHEEVSGDRKLDCGPLVESRPQGHGHVGPAQVKECWLGGFLWSETRLSIAGHIHGSCGNKYTGG